MEKMWFHYAVLNKKATFTSIELPSIEVPWHYYFAFFATFESVYKTLYYIKDTTRNYVCQVFFSI
jgi:hypothetical protein